MWSTISQKNTSLAGVLRTLSKLILCLVMIRGRHRGLPLAYVLLSPLRRSPLANLPTTSSSITTVDSNSIDRSIILPSELGPAATSDAASSTTKLGRRASRVSVRSAGVDSAHSAPGGGLDMVPTETDQARVLRARQESNGAASQEAVVDHGFAFTKPGGMRWARGGDDDDEGRDVTSAQEEEGSSASSKEVLEAEEARRAATAARGGP